MIDAADMPFVEVHASIAEAKRFYGDGLRIVVLSDRSVDFLAQMPGLFAEDDSVAGKTREVEWISIGENSDLRLREMLEQSGPVCVFPPGIMLRDVFVEMVGKILESEPRAIVSCAVDLGDAGVKLPLGDGSACSMLGQNATCGVWALRGRVLLEILEGTPIYNVDEARLRTSYELGESAFLEASLRSIAPIVVPTVGAFAVGPLRSRPGRRRTWSNDARAMIERIGGSRLIGQIAPAWNVLSSRLESTAAQAPLAPVVPAGVQQLLSMNGDASFSEDVIRGMVDTHAYLGQVDEAVALQMLYEPVGRERLSQLAAYSARFLDGVESFSLLNFVRDGRIAKVDCHHSNRMRIERDSFNLHPNAPGGRPARFLIMQAPVLGPSNICVTLHLPMEAGGAVVADIRLFDELDGAELAKGRQTVRPGESTFLNLSVRCTAASAVWSFSSEMAAGAASNDHAELVYGPFCVMLAN